jgi:hypothetical protein
LLECSGGSSIHESLAVSCIQKSMLLLPPPPPTLIVLLRLLSSAGSRISFRNDAVREWKSLCDHLFRYGYELKGF